MGGVGSGRTGGRPTAEAADSLVLTTKGLLKGAAWGASGTRILTFRDGYDGELLVGARVDTTDHARPYVALAHETRDGTARQVAYAVRLTITTPRYGGVRWFFICPVTGRRTSKLYLPLGGRKFLSRAAHGLAYGVTRLDKLARRQRRAGRVLAKLGRPGADWTDWAPRPKWMRQRSYERLCDELARAQEEGETIFLAEARRRFGHLLDAR